MAEKKDCIFREERQVFDGTMRKCTALREMYCTTGECNFYKSNKEWAWINKRDANNVILKGAVKI